jgi:hypothetical protein
MINTNLEQFLSPFLVGNYILSPVKLQFSKTKRNKQTPLPPFPEININLSRKICVTRDQLRPGSFLHKREEPGNEVEMQFAGEIYSSPFSYPEPFLREVRRGALAKSKTGNHKNMVKDIYVIRTITFVVANQMPV